MKKIFFFFFLFIGSISYCQSRLKFEYDSAGNQTKRYICFGCEARVNPDEVFKDAKTLTEKDMIRDEEQEQLLYYPNPVLEELYVKWANGKNPVSHIELYNLNGQSIKSITNLENIDTVTIPFFNLPVSYYTLVLNYTNGETKKLKIIKNQK